MVIHPNLVKYQNSTPDEVILSTSIFYTSLSFSYKGVSVNLVYPYNKTELIPNIAQDLDAQDNHRVHINNITHLKLAI